MYTFVIFSKSLLNPTQKLLVSVLTETHEVFFSLLGNFFEVQSVVFEHSKFFVHVLLVKLQS